MAKNSNYPKRGDKVDLHQGNGTKYRTAIDDVMEDGLLVMPVPSYKWVPMTVQRGDKYIMDFYRQNGRFMCDVKVRSTIIEGYVQLLLAEITCEPKKEQNRDSYRLPVAISVTMYQFADGNVPRDLSPITAISTVHTKTKDISASGALVVTKSEYMVKESILVALYLYGDEQPPVMLAAKIARQIHEPAENVYMLGFQFLGDTSKQSSLQKFVLEEQRKQVKWQRSIRGDDE